MSDTELDVLLLAGRFQVRGSCAYTLRLVRALADQGVRTRLVCPDASLVALALRSQAGIREIRNLDNPVWSHWALHRLLREVRGAGLPRLIHIQSRRMLKQGSWLARQIERPYVLTAHEHLKPRERVPIDHRWCRRIIAVSQSVKDDLVQRAGVPADLVVVIASGVETDACLRCRAPLAPDHVPVIGTAGPLEVIKGLPFFLGAARQVLAAGRDVEFLVAGAGPEEANLRRMARDLEISHKVTFVPYLLEFTDSLAAMDIFCLPSLQQGLGTVMLEAMALGRPVIASSVGGVSSIVRNGETGLTVPPSNSAALARQILDLLDNPVRAREIGAAARRLVEEKFSVERMVRQTVDLYRELMPHDLSQPASAAG